MFCITESATGSVLKRRIERRVRKKLCRSVVVKVKVDGFDPVNNPSLTLAVLPGSSVVFKGELVDMLICTFFCKSNNFTAHTKIPILYIRILDGHRNSRTRLHILVLYASFIGIDENIVTVGAEPNRRDLRRAIGHDGCKIEQGFCFFFE